MNSDLASSEIGVWKGAFSNLLIDAVQPSLLYLTDPWDGMVHSGDKDGKNIASIDLNAYFTEHITAPLDHWETPRIIKAYSDVLRTFADHPLDSVCIDGAQRGLSTT